MPVTSVLNPTSEAFEQTEDLLQKNCFQSWNFSMSRRKKQGSGVILTVLMYQRKAAETHLVKALTATSLFLGKHPKINNPISGLVRIISTAALPLQHLVARRQSSERVCTFKNTICMSLSQSFYHRASCADGQESRTCNKCPHKGHERVESWRKVRPVFIPLLSFFTGSTTLWPSLAFALESLSPSYSHILSVADTSFELWNLIFLS